MNKAESVKEEAPLLSLMALLFGGLAQYLFVDQMPGASVPVMVAAFYGVFFYISKGKSEAGVSLAKQPFVLHGLFAAVILLSMSYLLFDNGLFRFLNVPVLAVLLVLHPLLLRQGTGRRKEIGGWFGAWIYAAVGAPLERLPVPFRLIAGRLRSGRQDNPAARKLRSVGLGILLALPVLAVALVLLMSADSIFSSWLDWIPQTLSRVTFGEGVFRTIFALVAALYLFCFLWALVVERLTNPFRRRPELHPELIDRPSGGWGEAARFGEALRLDPLAAATFLFLINALYVLFAAVQFAYLFGAARGLLPDGVNYADYTHQGFAQLVLVALINLGLLLLGLRVIRPGSPGMERLRKILLSLLIGCTLVMLISAFSRLSLYEDAYGYTVLRLLVHGFMFYVGALFLAALVRIWREGLPLAKLFLAISAIAYLAMNYVNLDARIAANNLDRYERTGKIDFVYLGTLSADAYPALHRFQMSHHAGGGPAELQDILDSMREEARNTLRHGWPSWNLASWRTQAGHPRPGGA